MRTPGVLNSTKQLANVVLGTVATILLLESGGLTLWAKRLEIGPARTAAVHATTALHRHLQPLGVESLRQNILVSLQKTGWSDDAAPIAPRLGSALNASLAGLSPTCMTARSFPAAVPAIPSKPAGSVPRKILLTPLPPVAAGRPRVVALVGDSMMAVGLSSVLLRDSAQNKNLQILKAFRLSSDKRRCRTSLSVPSKGKRDSWV